MPCFKSFPRRPATVALFAALLPPALLSGCGHTPTAADIPPGASFTANILADDTKLFVYSQGGRGMGGRGPDGELPDARQEMPREGRDGRRGARAAPPDLQKAVTAMIEQNHYCRDGYMVLEQYEQHGAYIVRGECRDAATPADRQKFTH